MATSNKVKIASGTQLAYDNLRGKDRETFYACTDTHNIYYGSDLIFSETSSVSLSIDKYNNLKITMTYGDSGMTVLSFSDYTSPQDLLGDMESITSDSHHTSSTITSDNITSGLLSSSSPGQIYKVSDGFTIGSGTGEVGKSLFIGTVEEKTYSSGTEIVVVSSGSGNKFDIPSSSSGGGGGGISEETDPIYSNSAASGITSGDIESWNSKKSNVQSDWDATTGDSVILHKPTIPDITGKADKVLGATSGNFASLDSSGNLLDSGKKASDFALASKAVPTGGTSGQVLTKQSGTDNDVYWTTIVTEGGDPVVSSYNDLTDKPQINSVTLSGNKSIADLGLATAAQGQAADEAYKKPSGGIPSSDLSSDVQSSLGKADSAYQKPSGGIPSSDLTSDVQTALGKISDAYEKPSGGIPSSDLSSDVQSSLSKADEAYKKPSGGIPSSDLSSSVQISLGKADSALQSYTETDPTVPSWAKAVNKPTYTATEVGALPSSTVIPTEEIVSSWGFTKNTGTYSKPSGGIPSSDLSSAVRASLGKADAALQTETDPTVPSWAKASSKPTYTASEVGALPNTTVIPDENTVSGWGFTKNTGTITGVKFNNTSATVSSGIASISATIPDETTVSGWGFTKGGITDIKFNNVSATVSSGVASITASIPDETTVAGWGFTKNGITGIKMNSSSKTPSSGIIDLGSVLTPDNTVAIYSGSSAPSSGTGKNGDIYIQTTS